MGLRLLGAHKSLGSWHPIPMIPARGDCGLGERAARAVWTWECVSDVLSTWLFCALVWRVGIAVGVAGAGGVLIPTGPVLPEGTPCPQRSAIADPRVTCFSVGKWRHSCLWSHREYVAKPGLLPGTCPPAWPLATCCSSPCCGTLSGNHF